MNPAQVADRRTRFGDNRLTPVPQPPWWTLYLEKFRDPIIRVLMVAAGLSVLVGWVKGEHLEGVTIVITIFLATFLGFLNEYKAGAEFRLLLQAREDVPAKVMRNGEVKLISRGDLVVDDVLLVATGDELPADGLVLEAFSLAIDQSKLTGESIPSGKRPGPQENPGQAGPFESAGRETAQPSVGALDKAPPLRGTPPGGMPPEEAVQAASSGRPGPGRVSGTRPADREPDAATEDYSDPARVFRGTIVADGHGVVRLTAVGDATELGKLIRAVQEQPIEPTPLGRQLERLGGAISVLGFSGAAGIFAALLGRGWWSGEFRPTPAEGTFFLAASAGLMVGTSPIWLTALYDFLKFVGFEVTAAGLFPADEREAHRRSWGWALRFTLVFLAIGWMMGDIPPASGPWFSPHLGETLLRYGMIVVAIIVVAVPEGLSMAVTLCLAFAMRHMYQARSLVRRMDACETIGAATVICSDKTGTLTRNEMVVTDTLFPCLENDLVSEAIAVNSTAHLCHEDPDRPRPIGNFTEGALLAWLLQRGADYREWREGFSLERQWTFSAERKWMATRGLSSRIGQQVLHLKGAPEVLLDLCTRIATPDGTLPLAEADRTTWSNRLQSLQEQGKRTLGFAFREGISPGAPAGVTPESRVDGGEVRSHDQSETDPRAEQPTPDPETLPDTTGLVWLGCVGIADPIRTDVPTAVASCRRAGIQVKIVTGDHPKTALAVARQIGLDGPGKPGGVVSGLLLGEEFRAMDDRQIMALLPDLQVLARAKPLDKLRLVSLLQRAGQVVAVTGDGVNDAPALQRADVGLAMGACGTDTAKEASDIVLLDDSFTSITRAVLWGRSLYVNIQRFLIFQLSINLAALGLTFLAPLLGLPLPFTVLQMLWINLIMDSFAALALATEPPDPDLMNQPPRAAGRFIVTPAMMGSIIRFGGACVVVFLGLLVWFGRNGPVNPVNLSVFFTAFVLVQFWNLLTIRRWGLHIDRRTWIPENPWFLVILGVILTGQILLVQFGGATFRTVPLSLTDWVLLLGLTSLTLLFPHPPHDAG